MCVCMRAHVCVLMFFISLSTVPEICLLSLVLKLHAFLILTLSGELHALAALVLGYNIMFVLSCGTSWFRLVRGLLYLMTKVCISLLKCMLH